VAGTQGLRYGGVSTLYLQAEHREVAIPHSKKPTPRRKAPAVAPPRVPSKEAFDELPDQELIDNESYAELHLGEMTLGGADGVGFRQVRLQRVDWRAVGMRSLDLTDVRLGGCDLSNSRWSNVGGLRVAFIDCRLTGFGLLTSRIKDLLFSGCLAPLALFEGSEMRQARFERCNLSEANFNGADLTGVVFDDCELHDATFTGAKLLGADFRSSNIESSRVALTDLRGAMLAPLQALALFERYTGAMVESAAGEEPNAP
jgi:uncharacterized protein YjbI with pentapeptide repeats